MRHGGQILADQLKLHGVRRVFSVPGESFLAALDGLYESGIENIVCRHEGGAGYMAVADGRLTRRPGLALVSRGPGASNAAIAVHTAQQDAVPMILVIGQIAARDLRREAFQEIDYQNMFGSIARYYEEEFDTAVDNMSTLIEPIMIVFMGTFLP